MDTSSPRENPKKRLEPKVLSQSSIDNLHSDTHELPTLLTDTCSLATCSHIIIVCHIDIEYKLLVLRNEPLSDIGNGGVLLRRHVVNSSNINFNRLLLYQLFFEFLRIFEALISAVNLLLHVSFKCETELSIVKVLAGLFYLSGLV
jgi:hypothetical protein